MTNEQVRNFVDTYAKYYYSDISEEEKSYGKSKLGISIIHATSKSYEEYNIMPLLRKGRQSIQTIAWKMGASITDDGIKSQYYEYPNEIIEEFCKRTNTEEFNFNDEDGIREAYDRLLSTLIEMDITGYGSVYIISSMFFLSKGKVPIYDYYACVAAKALYYNLNPQDIYVAQPPVKDEHSKGNREKKLAVNMLYEYKSILSKLFCKTDYYNCDEGFIARDLDRSLWVYGHATNKFHL